MLEKEAGLAKWEPCKWQIGKLTFHLEQLVRQKMANVFFSPLLFYKNLIPPYSWSKPGAEGIILYDMIWSRWNTLVFKV